MLDMLPTGRKHREDDRSADFRAIQILVGQVVKMG